ncbi:MAG: YXWGXW repeat-containing protein [Acidobacteria bacterium]|nr:YXWGXW repeat-containing protein [Acidobacteriota bacterium]
MKKMFLAGLLLASSVAFAGTSFYIGGSWGNRRPAPVRVYSAPPPPPRMAYVRPPMPRPGYVWVDGYYDYGPRGYMWRPGYWAARPDPRAMWVAPRYDRGGYVGGYWRR